MTNQAIKHEKGMELTNEHISRQIDLVPPSILETPVTVIGAGAIGSWVVLCLAKMGFLNIAVFDHDEVDIVNMSSQFFGLKDIGTPKVLALRDRVKEMTGTTITAIGERYVDMKLKGVVVMAVDSMEVREKIFKANQLNLGCKWIVDARMGSETALIFTFNPNSETDIEFYQNSLYSDKDAIQERCTAKSTTYCAVVQSGLVVKTIRDVLTHKKYMRNMTFSLKESDFLAFTEVAK